MDNFLQQKLEDKKEKLKNRKELTQDEIDNSIKSKVIRRKKGEKSVKTEPYQFQIRKNYFITELKKLKRITPQ